MTGVETHSRWQQREKLNLARGETDVIQLKPIPAIVSGRNQAYSCRRRF